MTGKKSGNITRKKRNKRAADPGGAAVEAGAGGMLLEDHGLLRTLIDLLPDYIYVKDTRSRFVINNPAHARILGVNTPEEVTGKTDFECFPRELAEQYFAHDQQVMRSGQPLLNHEERVVDRAGRETWVSTTKVPLRNGRGEVVGLVGMSRDITERKRAEEERDRFFNLSLDLLCIADFDGYFKRLNPAWGQTLGYATEELLSKPYFDFVHPDDRARTAAEAQKLTTGALTISFENRYRKKDGSYIWLLWTTAPDLERKLLYAVARDITDRKRAEEEIKALNEQLERRVHERTAELEAANRELENEIVERQRLSAQLLQSQKMEAVGRLAGGVAHDFNNLLTVITGYAELLLSRAGTEGPPRKYAEEIKKAGDRAASLTRQLLAFGRRQVMMPQVLELNTVVANMDKMLQRLIGEDIDLVTVLGTGLGRVKADPGQVEQVIMNLAVNARDAMPEGGKLTLETANADLDESYARGHATVIPGPYVMLAASDTGHGMDTETQSHIFEPFFTTKEPGKGTGLGLATAYGIVKQSGGYIWVYSEPGKGATFKIYFPRVEEVAERFEPAKPVAAEALQGSETILLVEDEPAVRALAVQVLQSKGYRVLAARQGEDALIVTDQHKGAIHLLVTDVVMPQMGGRELAERLRPFHREMKVLYISGYTDSSVFHHGVLEQGAAFLQKPFTPDLLVRKVREVLDKR